MPRRGGKQGERKASCSLTEVVFVLVLLACGFMIGFVGSHTSSEEDAPVRLRQHPAIPPRHIAEQHSSGPLNASMWGHIPQPFEGYASKCGPTPEEGYPKTAPIADIIKNWNPDAGKWTPSHMYESVCRFDYATDLDKAIAYRDAEVPFQLYNVPSMNAVARAWSDPAHLRRKLGATTKYKCEASNPGGEANFGANHFMYTNGRSSRNPPIKNVQLSWDDWLRKIDEAVNTSVLEPNSRFYIRFSASNPSDARSGWLFKELPFFQPKPNVFFKDPRAQRGIHCRFGMEGIVAEAHWDGSRNTIAQFYGRRRYVLVDPDHTCDMYLLAKNHPSGRHSKVDWSNPDSWEKFPDFPTMPAHEVVQRPGDFLYLPTYYLHYIVSIDTNYQCNTRSGRDDRQLKVVNKCTPGFEKQASPPRRGKKPWPSRGKF